MLWRDGCRGSSRECGPGLCGACLVDARTIGRDSLGIAGSGLGFQKQGFGGASGAPPLSGGYRNDRAICGCLHEPLGNGAPCDDGQACTDGDRCLAGNCEGEKFTCGKVDSGQDVRKGHRLPAIKVTCQSDAAGTENAFCEAIAYLEPNFGETE